MYTALYTFNQIVSKRTDMQATANSLRSIIQSSLFLGFNAYAVIIIFCMTRRVMGKFYYILAAHIPAIIGSFLAIQLERPSRRTALSFYVANIAGETVFNKLIHKGLFPVIPKGEVALFAASTAALLYLLHKNGFGKDPVSIGFRFLLGKQEFSQVARESIDRTHWSSSSKQRQADNKQRRGYDVEEEEELVISKSQDQGSVGEDVDEKDNRKSMMREQGRITGYVSSPCPDPLSVSINEQIGRKDGTTFVSPDYLIKGQPTINLACPHSRSPPAASASSTLSDSDSVMVLRSPGVTLSSLIRSLLWSPSLETSSCTRNAVHAFMRNFLIAFTGQTVVSLLMRPHLLIKDPINIMRETLLKDKRNLNLGLFVASFATLFKGTGCLIRASCRHWNPELGSRLQDQGIVTLVSGLVAGSAMLFNPSSTAAQYMMWKLIETAYFDAVRRGSVKYVEFTMNMLYAVSTAQLFYVAVMEPKMMRRSYTKWLNRVTRNSFGLLNRNIIDIFGTESSFGYTVPEFDLDVNHCSEKFKESVLVWMI